MRIQGGKLHYDDSIQRKECTNGELDSERHIFLTDYVEGGRWHSHSHSADLAWS